MMRYRRRRIYQMSSGASSADVALDNLVLHLEADDLSLSNDAAVTSWSDQSTQGNNAAQATGTNQPVYKTNIQNGLPAVLFDGTDDYLEIAADASLQFAAYSVFVLVKPGATPGGVILGEDYSWEGTDETVRFEIGYNINDLTGSVPNAGHFAGGSWYLAEDDADAAGSTVAGYLATFGGSTVKLYDLDNTLIGESGAAGATAGNDKWWVGRRHDNAGITHFPGHMFALRVYDKELSASERASLLSAYRSKYGL